MSDDRFAVDLTEFSDTIPTLPDNSMWQGRIAKAEGKTGTKEATGNFWGRLDIFIAIKGQDAAKILNRDDPRIYHNIFVAFDKSEVAGKTVWTISKTNNPDLKAFLKALDLLSYNFMEDVDTSVSSEEVWQSYLNNMANILVGYDCTIKVGKKPDSQDKNKMRNVITNFAKADL